MIIADARIALAASHDYRETHDLSETLDFSLEQPIPNQPDRAEDTGRWNEQVTISTQGFSLLELNRGRQTLDLSQGMDSRSRINFMILQKLYESITGHAMKLSDPLALSTDVKTLDVQTPDANTRPVQTDAPERPVNSNKVRANYQRHERYQEQEKLEFKAAGVIHTSDGRSINFESSLTMSRDYVEESHLDVDMGAPKKVDPLVINFDGKGAQLGQTRFNFDLDADGDEEQLASLRPGSGFLVLDRNGDGVVNNGSELFGPSTGQGFSELAQFDEDNNHFIDEADSIYHKLRIWTTNEDGSKQLLALGDKQIGAIFLGHMTSPFQLKDNSNQSLGEVAATGIYMREDGQTGVVQEINLTV